MPRHSQRSTNRGAQQPLTTHSRQTNVLVVGELGWPLLDDGRPSNKLSRAGSYGIPVVSERRFLEWIGKAVPDSLHRTHSADQIAALSKLSSSTIDELVRFGLLDPREGLFGFRDLASARQVSSLFANGIALSEIIRSVKEVEHGSLKLIYPICDCIQPLIGRSKLNNPRAEPISAASLCCQSARLSRTPML
jgi:hypothetical protein